jgi:hypothetical protein
MLTLSMLFSPFTHRQFAAQRNGSPAADSSKTRPQKTTSSAKWPPLFHAKGGQVEPVSGSCLFDTAHIAH